MLKGLLVLIFTFTANHCFASINIEAFKNAVINNDASLIDTPTPEEVAQERKEFILFLLQHYEENPNSMHSIKVIIDQVNNLLSDSNDNDELVILRQLRKELREVLTKLYK